MNTILKIKKHLIFTAPLLILLSFGCAAENKTDVEPWKKLDSGFFLGIFDPPQKSEIGDSKITVVKIDPRSYSLKLFSASQHDNNRKSAKNWCKDHRLIGAVNAGMFQTDLISNVGYMKNFDHLNNAHLNKYNSILAFNRVDSTVPEVQIIDRDCQDFESLQNKYKTLVQNIRMISCEQENVWSRQAEKWSIVALGMDRSGNILFIFSQSPYTVHDFINILFELPLSLYNAMYLEGGPEASLYLSYGNVELDLNGNFETGFSENTDIKISWPLPNVIGFVKKEK
jgi:uncharacterized protein YigE (DUF2233 family)